MVYIKPTDEVVRMGVEFGWAIEDAKRGYVICDFDGTGLLEINRIDDMLCEDYDVTDDDCAIEAERSGFCKIIPVEELPTNMDYEGNSRRYFGWVDTPSNRENIRKFFADQN